MVKGIICCFTVLYLIVIGQESVTKILLTGSVVYNFTASVSEAINEAIPSVKPKSFTFPHWFPKSLIYYIKKKNKFFQKYKKSKSDYYYYYSIFSYYYKLVKTNSKTDRLDWLKVLMII
jgi:hypothetical protein